MSPALSKSGRAILKEIEYTKGYREYFWQSIGETVRSPAPPTDLRYLAFTAILTASLWIPYVVSQVMTNGPLKPQNYLDPTQRPIPLWGKRADRAYLNAVETFAPFAALVIVAHLAGKANAMTAFWAGCYFWLRLAHAVVYMLGIPLVRTIIFALGYVAIAGIFWEVIK
jgi:uncharacterized MAPEG superfamily protein